jgi:hypothetical protein
MFGLWLWGVVAILAGLLALWVAWREGTLRD